MDNNNNFADSKNKDRKNILEKTKNISLIKAFFHNGIEFDYESDFFDINPDLMQPRVELTEKYGIFFSLKGGSSVIFDILKEFKLSDIDITINKGYNDYISSKVKPNEVKYIDSVFTPLDLILNGQSKKDLIIVTRNPVYKFLSGLYQDIMFELVSSNILTEIYVNNHNFINNQYRYNQEIIKSIDDDTLCFLAYNLLKYRSISGQNICYGHSFLFNEFYYSLLTNNKINNTKLKIVDLDDPNSDLIQCLRDYNPEIVNNQKSKNFWTHRPYHEILLKGIEKLCHKYNNLNILNNIKKEVRNDFYYYMLIRNSYKKNIYKNYDEVI